MTLRCAAVLVWLVVVSRVAMAQTPPVYVYAYDETPDDQQVVTIDVVLNALDAVTRKGDPFGAWQLAEFRIQLKSTGDAIPASAYLPIADDAAEAAAGFNRNFGGRFGVSTLGNAWVSGVRPAPQFSVAGHNGNSASNGGARLQSLDYAVSPRRNNKAVILATNTGNKAIGGFQHTATLPTNNLFINTRAVYEIFRFRLRYEDRFGAVRIRFDGTPAVAYYADLASSSATFLPVERNRKAWLNRGAVGGSAGGAVGPTGAIGEPIPAAPGVALIGVASLVVGRRRV